MFDDNFLESLPDDPVEGGILICKKIRSLHNQAGGSIDFYSDYMEAYALLSTYLEINSLNYGLNNLGEDKAQNLNQFMNSVTSIHNSLEQRLHSASVNNFKEKFKAKLKGGFCYEFSEGDLNRIQVLINELRDKINGFSDFEESHRQRLLSRLERLQSELHKKVSDVDRFWGLVGDAGVVVGKFGKDAKPFVDRIREIADIVWRTQSRAEELPSDSESPLLPRPDEGET